MHWIWVTGPKGERMAMNLEHYRLLERIKDKDGNPVTVCYGVGITSKISGEVIDVNVGVLETPDEMLSAPVIEPGKLVAVPPSRPLADEKVVGIHEVKKKGRAGARSLPMKR